MTQVAHSSQCRARLALLRRRMATAAELKQADVPDLCRMPGSAHETALAAGSDDSADEALLLLMTAASGVAGVLSYGQLA